jgi:alkylhydroperoxidase/carboxymuconolactone decarboxylase family protein YurZ
VWNRPELPARDRSLITVAVLAAAATPGSCRSTSGVRSGTASAATS